MTTTMDCGVAPCESREVREFRESRDVNRSREVREVRDWSLGEVRQPNLNRCLLIFKALIRVSRVDGGIRSLAAAPDGPETRPLV